MNKILFVKIVAIIFLILFILFVFIYYFKYYRLTNQVFFPAKNSDKKELVVVLHGIAKTNRIMYNLSKRISNSGYDVYNITYPSTEYTIQELADFLHEKIIELNIDKADKINFVGHSMGGLLIRVYINKYQPKNLNRVVMVGTPNHGSELADIFKNWYIFKKKFGVKAGRQLGTDLENLDEYLDKSIDYELGIIAGKTKLNPLFSVLIPGDDDGLVSVESTKLDGMKDHIVMNFQHTSGIKSKKVSNKVIQFLNEGKF